ncbi:hypothetical protein PIB30_058156 [Stylosanthes scabra]|uniref:DUF4378 domain-containing protein n=1 Tax=Stylosanthes scabra TaxID=79078 RepID=A0ABU6ZIL4_9FABA|nr:hypothetical protein [Stylosanthes scabra]
MASGRNSLSKNSQIMQSMIKSKKHVIARSNSLLLKDYLMRDDLSSCSSNGFKSFPRRPCCSTAVGFLVAEKDLKSCNSRRRRRSRRNTTTTTTLLLAPRSSSVLQRASEAVIRAIKSLPHKSSGRSKKDGSGSVFSRSFSRKLLSRSFWRKAEAKEEEGEGSTQRWIRTSFRELLMQDSHKTASLNQDSAFTTNAATSSSSSWGESEFTFSSSSAAASSCSMGSAENDVVQVTKDPLPPTGKIQQERTRDWPNEEKEQLSPVSVLDCPFEDDNEGIEQKRMQQKRRHFKAMASVKPMSLEKLMSMSKLNDDDDNNEHYCSGIVIGKHNNNDNDGLLSSKELEICKVAEDWVVGNPQELYLGWEVKKGRELYIREMEKCLEWRNYNDTQQVQHLAIELETEVFTALINELLLDLWIC